MSNLHLRHNLPALHVSVPQSQEAHQESHHGACHMGHVAHVVVVFCQNSVVDGPADVPQDEEGDHQHLQCSQSLPVNSVDSSVQMRPEIKEDGSAGGGRGGRGGGGHLLITRVVSSFQLRMRAER